MENNTPLKDYEFNDLIEYIYNEFKDYRVDGDFYGEYAHQLTIDRVEEIIEEALETWWVGTSGQYIYDFSASYILEDVLEAVAEYFREKGLVADEYDEDEEDDDDDYDYDDD